MWDSHRPKHTPHPPRILTMCQPTRPGWVVDWVFVRLVDVALLSNSAPSQRHAHPWFHIRAGSELAKPAHEGPGQPRGLCTYVAVYTHGSTLVGQRGTLPSWS